MKNKELAYKGKYTHYKRKLYMLVPELKKHMCEGCDLYSKDCPRDITDLCTQGFILKKVGR